MNEYRFILNDYHAIKEADISIDGITVIAGCNGCGKSTISKWLYAFIKYSNDFNRLVDERLLKQLNGEIRKMLRILRNIDLDNIDTSREFKSISPSIFYHEDFNYDDLFALFESKLRSFCSVVDHAVSNSEDRNLRRWLQKSLGSEDSLFGDFLSSYFETSLNDVNEEIRFAQEAKYKGNTDELLYFIRKELDIYGDYPRNFSLEENGMRLIEPYRFRPPLGLRNAIYIDTPMALSKHPSSENYIWDSLMKSLTYPIQEMPKEALNLLMLLRRIMGGKVIVNKDDLNRDNDIRYIRKDDGLDIPIDEAATGLKTFAYMMRLLENGYLNQNSLLLIDEPEAHLHPQWIVEFAKVLVLVHKVLGTKILIASHNPDMIAALQSISRAEGIAEVTKFYQAKQYKPSLKYYYEYLGNDIEKIFSSFNVALERIKYYGE